MSEGVEDNRGAGDEWRHASEFAWCQNGAEWSLVMQTLSHLVDGREGLRRGRCERWPELEPLPCVLLSSGMR
jgi:hypothetical protein